MSIYSKKLPTNIECIDVYDVLRLFNVECPAMQHAIKKCLMPGVRGAKDKGKDKAEAIASIQRSIEMDDLY